MNKECKKKPLRSISIKGNKYKIIFEDLFAKYKEPWLGICEKDKKIIRVHNLQSPEEQKKVFLHEYAHAVIHESCLDQALTDEIEEVLCENIAQCFYNLIY